MRWSASAATRAGASAMGALNWSAISRAMVAARLQEVERGSARDAFDPAHALRDAAFGRDDEHRDVAGARDVRAAAEFDRVRRVGFRHGIAEAQHAHFIAVLLAEQRHRARLDRLVRRHHADFRRSVLADDGVHFGLDRFDVLARHRRGVREVETEIVGLDQRALLRDVLAQTVAQRRMQQVRRRMVGADLGAAHAVDLQFGDVADLGRPRDHLADMREHIAGALLHVVDAETPAAGEEDLALVARLAAAFGVERRLVEHEFGLVARLERLRPARRRPAR